MLLCCLDMERAFQRSVQGGGCGKGYVTPRSIALEDNRAFEERVPIILLMCDMAISIANTEEEKATATSWKKLLAFTLAVLKRKKIQIDCTRSYRQSMAVSNESSRYEHGNFDFQELYSNHAAPRGLACDGGPVNKSCLNDGKRQIIPGIPKAIEKAVDLWRFGSVLTFGKPMRLFRTADGRRENIPNFSNSIWVKHNQKQAFARYHRLMKYMATLVDDDQTILEEQGIELEEKWKLAVVPFKRRHPRASLSQVMSSARKLIEEVKNKRKSGE